MNTEFALEEVAHLPAAKDNCAVATVRLEPKTRIRKSKASFQLDYTVLEGHRFAVQPIASGEAMLSWGMPFGYAVSNVYPGNYVINQGTLEELGRRLIDFPLPSYPNFRDQNEPFIVDRETFRPGQQVPLYNRSRSFQGYFRGHSRGTGTRNYIVLLATNSRTGSYARSLSQTMRQQAEKLKSVDGVVAVAHTEAGGADHPNNLEHILRTLAGFVVHPNVGSVLVLDEGSAWVNNTVLKQYMIDHRYPLGEVPHEFFTLGSDFRRSLDQGRKIVASWLETVDREVRRSQPLEDLKVALQCGGSDSFSGLSANPLIALVAREILRNGGSANLAETNELVGAESYILSNVRNLKTSYQFLLKIEEFKNLMKWHGHTPEQNPSGGNRFRGLYNIALKSIGAAQKKHPDVRLDYVIDYAERMVNPGYYFMNSPGNDLESIAGQVASGANIIFFSTGNGSITNFPFVPTIKVMSTTPRYQLMPADMDINAGAHLDGVPLEVLAEAMFERTIEVASSTPSQGERAGHSQISIWRNWEQTGLKDLLALEENRQPDGTAIELGSIATEPATDQQKLQSGSDWKVGHLGLVLPNSLCSSEVARILSERLNRITSELSVSRVVTLAHTEGCGAVSGPSQELLVRTLIGYMTHPLVTSCLLLEHGCENVHHEYLRRELLRRKLATEQFGWVSIQLDGGIEQAARKAEEWFRTRAGLVPSRFGTTPLTIAITMPGTVPVEVIETLAHLTQVFVESGVNVIVPQSGRLGGCKAYFERLGGLEIETPSLRYAEPIRDPGFHIMETPSNHWVELLTGLGAAGTQLILAYVSDGSLQGHPFVPVIQFSSHQVADVDLVLDDQPSDWPDQLLRVVNLTLSGNYVCRTQLSGNNDSQVPRGPRGFSV